jgi:hypothetical protein
MDEGLQRATRAFRETPSDPEVAEALATLALRVGDPLLALDGARIVGGELHRSVAERLAHELGLSLIRLAPTETFRTRDGRALLLISAGAYLEEGPTAWRSSLEPGGSRAALKRVVLPAYLISVWPRSAYSHREAKDLARQAGGRLPTEQEWKKAWRGGLFLDGDAVGLVPNLEPDRLRPSAEGDPDDRLDRSDYGLLLPQAASSAEWTSRDTDVSALASEGRYRVPVSSITVAGWRLVLDM